MAFKRATMDFFGAQEYRRRTTAILVFHFALAVLITGLATYAIIILYWKAANAYANDFRAEYHRPLVTIDWWDPRRFGIVAGGIGLYMLTASAWQMRRLMRPVAHVMAMVGATRVTRDVRHPPTRRFIAVVEEMAIASGIPVPDTYVITRSTGINALAVGLSPSAGAVAVTQGAITMLSRDELQGVVAHEFSHILNGDMALNVRMMGVLHGVDSIGMAGHLMIRALVAASRNGLPGSENTPAAIAWVGFFLSLPFLLISYLGLALGSLIRAAVSRQREYLADAAAVQFTRMPAGIAGALRKIGGLTTGSRVGAGLLSARTSHFFFAQSIMAPVAGHLLGDTHPPLATRIRKIDPEFDGSFPDVPSYYTADMGDVADAAWLPHRESPAEAARKTVQTAMGISAVPETFQEILLSNPDEILATVGVPRAEHLAYVDRVMQSIPEDVRAAAREMLGAEAVLYLLLLNADDAVCRKQFGHLREHVPPDVLAHLQKLESQVRGLGAEARLPLVDIAIGPLRDMTKTAFLRLEENLLALIRMDGREDLFEFFLSNVVSQHLAPLFRRQKPGVTFRSTFASVRADALQLVTCIAAWEELRRKDGAAALARGAGGLGVAAERTNVLVGDMRELGPVLERLALAEPFVKKQVLAACVATVVEDKRISLLEAELLRAIADSIKCPLPPIIVGPARHVRDGV